MVSAEWQLSAVLLAWMVSHTFTTALGEGLAGTSVDNASWGGALSVLEV